MGPDERCYRRRKEGEIPSAKDAIRFACAECMGHQPADVAGCTDPECWLYPWRRGTPPERKRHMTEEQCQAAGDRLKQARQSTNHVG